MEAEAGTDGRSGQLTVRQAKPADYNDVKDIHGNVYDGGDHLPSMFHIFLKQPNCHCFVGEVDGRVVAFTNQIVVFGGRAVVSASGRTHPEYSGRGLIGQLIERSRYVIRRAHPSIGRGVSLGVGNRFTDSVLRGERPGVNVLRVTHFLFYETSLSKLTSLVESNRNHHVTPEPLSPDHTRRLLASDETLRKFFPDGVLKFGPAWIPVIPSTETLVNVTRTSVTFYTAGSDTRSLQSLSYGAGIKASLFTPRYDVDYYHSDQDRTSDVKTNTDLFISHIIAHVRHTASTQRTGAPSALTLTFPRDLDLEQVKNFLRPYLGDNVRSDYFCTEYNFIIDEALPPLAKV